MEMSDATVDKVRRQFYDHFFGLVTEEEGEFIEGDVDSFHDITETAVNNQAKIDQMTDRALVAKWADCADRQHPACAVPRCGWRVGGGKDPAQGCDRGIRAGCTSLLP